MDEETADKLELSDQLIERICKTDKFKDVKSFYYDYSPKNGCITSIKPITIYKFITDLSLVGHKIKSIIPLQSFISLKKLNLSWNSLKSLLPLMKITTLVELTCNHNKITEIPKSISALKNLQILRLSFNPLSEVSIFNNLHSNINLKILDCEGTPILSDSYDYLYYILPQLTTINKESISHEQRLKANERYGSKLVNSQQMTSEKEKQKLLDQNSDLQQKLSFMKDQLSKLDTTNQELQNKIKEIQANDQTKTLRSQIQAISVQTNELLEGNENLLKTNNSLKEKLINERKKYHQEINEINDQIEKFQEEKEIIEAENTSLKQQIEEIKEQNNTHNMALQNSSLEKAKTYVMDAKDREIAALKQQIEDFQKYQILQQESVSKKQQKAKIVSLQSQLHQQELALNSQKASYESQIKELQAKLSKKEKVLEINQDSDTNEILQISERNKYLENAFLEAQNSIQDLSLKKSSLEQKVKIQNDNIMTCLKIRSKFEFEIMEGSPELVQTTLLDLMNGYAQQQKQISSMALQIHQKNEEICKLREEMVNTTESYRESMTNTVSKADYEALLLEINSPNSSTFEKEDPQIPILQKSLQKKNDKIEKLKKNTQKIEDQYQKDLFKLNEDLTKSQSTIQEQSLQIIQLQGTNQDLKNAIQKSDTFSKIREEQFQASSKKYDSQLAIMKTSYDDLQSQYRILNAKHNELFAEFSNMKDTLEQRNNDIYELENQLLKAHDEVKIVYEQISALEISRKKENENKTEMINSLQSQLQSAAETTQLETSKQDELLSQSQKEKRRIERKFSKLLTYYDELGKEKSKIEAKNSELSLENENLRNEIKSANKTAQKSKDLRLSTEQLFQNLTKKYNELQENYDNLKKTIQEKESSRTSVLKQITQLQEEATNLRNQADLDQKKIFELKQSNNEFQHAKIEAERNAMIMEDELQATKEILSKKQNELLFVKDENNKILEEKDKMKRTIDQLSKSASELSVENRSQLQQQALLQIEKENYEKEKEILQKKVSDFEQQISEMEEELHNLRSLPQQNEILESKITTVELEKTSALNENEKLKKELNESIFSKEQLKEEGEKQKQTFLEAKNEITSQLQITKTQLNDIRAELNQKNQTIQQLNQENRKLKETIEITHQEAEKARKEIESIRNEIQEEKDNGIRNVSSLKKQIHDLEELRDNLQQQVKNKDDSILEFEKEKETTLNENKNNYLSLQQKYKSLKKLQEYENQKHEALQSKQREIIESQLQSLRDANQKIQEAEHAQDEIALLKQQLEANELRISSLLSSNDKFEKGYVSVVEVERVKTQNIELKTRLQNALSALSSQKQDNDILKNELKRNEELIENEANENKKIMKELQNKAAKLAILVSEITSLHKASHSLQNKRKSDMISFIWERLNDIYSKLNLEALPKLATIVQMKLEEPTQSIVSILPNDNDNRLIKRQKELMKRVRSELLSFPIQTSMTIDEDGIGLDTQLEQLGKFVSLVKNLFISREAHIEEMGKLIQTQHQAVLQISQNAKSSESLSLSKSTFMKSQRILDADHNLQKSLK